MTSITIHLDDYDNSTKIEPDNLVHRKIYKALTDDIAASLLSRAGRAETGDSKTSRPDEDHYPPGSGLIHFIDGSRGAGKTTFLRTVYADLPRALSEDPPVGKCVQVRQLAYIDPTRLEGSEIILLNVLRALKLVAEKATPSLDNERRREDFRRHFKQLAGGLSLFRKAHDPLAHHDPELFFDRGLARAADSDSLRNGLHLAIDLACNMLGVDALLLAFDDADTNSRHAYKLLECFRSYLDTPRLVILVTGDMELYSLLTRRAFSLQLPTATDEPGESRQAQRIRMLDHLEDQYLLKLFPLRSRYHLKKLGRLLDEDGKNNTYQFRSTRWNEVPRTPISVMDEIIRRGLRVRSASDVSLFREHLLKQPLRSVLQVMQGCAPFLHETDEQARDDTSWSRDLSDAVRGSLRAMAQGSLYKKGIMVDDLAANYLPTLTKAVFELACEDGDVDTAAYLRPQASDDDLNNCYMSLAAEVAGLCAENPSNALIYMLAGPGSVSLWGKETRRMASRISPELLMKQFRQYMAVGRVEDALNWARRATAVLAAAHPTSPSSSVVDFGVIGLNKRKPSHAKKKDFKVIDAILRRQASSPDALPTIAYSMLDVSNQSSRGYASIYNILGLIERLLSADKSDIERRLSSTFPPLTISSPDWGESIVASGNAGNTDSDEPTDDDASKPDEDEGENDASPSADDASGKLVAAMAIWTKSLENIFENYAPSSILLGKIWVRTYFSLEKSSDRARSASRDGNKGLDDIMALSAACLINAFLVEEADHSLGKFKGTVDRTNPATSAASTLRRKTAFLQANRKQLPLTVAIASCPLVLGLLGTEERRIMTDALKLGALGESISELPPVDIVKNAFIAGQWQKHSGSAKSQA
ncbi:hypothetical protein GIY62_30065 [Burkholderia plantarii]|uniref:hypothetical protein n=1 Tax=Burkholderia plantarii TaxID=41899 RepID=UPI00272CF580|nr:hypothetical protein [Burkholderia plantarii]WLE61691.1 hypothetical protein GIY62_30065 [Burkholderia plantarii]